MRYRANGEGIHVHSVLGFPPLLPTQNYHHPPTLPTQSVQPKISLPIGPRTSLLLTSLMLSQQTLRLKLIAFSAESCGDELIISAENNTSRQGRLTTNGVLSRSAALLLLLLLLALPLCSFCPSKSERAHTHLL